MGMRMIIDENGDKRLVSWDELMSAARELEAEGVVISSMPADEAANLAVKRLDEKRRLRGEK